MPAGVLRHAVAPAGPKERTFTVASVATSGQIIADTLSRLRVDGHRVVGAAFEREAQGPETFRLMEISDDEMSDLGTTWTDLEPNGEDGAIAVALHQRLVDRDLLLGLPQGPQANAFAGLLLIVYDWS